MLSPKLDAMEVCLAEFCLRESTDVKGKRAVDVKANSIEGTVLSPSFHRFAKRSSGGKIRANF
jgi:hypothetical protein